MTTAEAHRSTRFAWQQGALWLWLILGVFRAHAAADATWPATQLLPSFPRPAANQDLIYVRGAPATWQAEALAHGTGHLDGDGWLCQTGVDAANKHMVYGPYVTNLPTGGNTARFRLKIDNNTADDAVQVTLDVRDNTNGHVLATKEVTRRQFTSAGDWVTFDLPFTFNDPGHGVEFRIYWHGGAYLKADSVSVDRGPEDELYLFASLKGVVNRTQPRIFSYEGDAFAEGPHAWLESLNLTFTEYDDNWLLLTKYKSEVRGLVVYDESLLDTVNLATTIASREKALVASPALVSRLTTAPYNFPIIKDLRGKFANKLAVYQNMLDVEWPALTHRVVLGLSAVHHKASLREYAVALGGVAVIWLDPNDASESPLLDRFLSGMEPGSAFMGWWTEEGAGVERASRHGIATVASDYATNLTMHSGMPRAVAVKPVPPKPRLENKLYVAFILSDGDNLQYVEHLMRKLWKDPNRGQVPMGWTVSPAMLDAMPGALDYYYRSGTPNDALVSGPSGYGYSYPNSYPDAASLEAFAAKSDDYATRAGLRVVTVWNTITGGIDADVGRTFANHAPSVLGLTAQNTGGGLTVYDGSLPGFALSCNYCTNEQAMKDHIARAAEGWDRASPRFILIQAQPWQGVTPTSFNNVKNSLGADYVVVRPDNWFQLLRQANGLAIEPHAPLADGVYRIVSDASGKCLALAGGSTADGAAVEQVSCDDDDAQRFRVTHTERGYVKIAALGDGSQVFDIAGGPGAVDEGAKLNLWDDLGGANQQFQPVWEAGDLYHLIGRHSDRCLDLPSGRADEHLQLQQWTCNGASAQRFRFADPVWPPPQPDPRDAGVAGSDAGGPWLADGGSSADGATGDGAQGADGANGGDGGGETGDGSGGTVRVEKTPGGCSSLPGTPGTLWPSLSLALALLGVRRRR